MHYKNTIAVFLSLCVVTETITLHKRPSSKCCNVEDRHKDDFEKCKGKNYHNMMCNNCNLTAVPDRYPGPRNRSICLLSLSFNFIQVIKNNSFGNVQRIRLLYLDHNNISCIQPDAFKGLSVLLYLGLCYNNLHWPSSDFHTGIFRPLAQLTYLNIKVNHFSSFENLDVVLSPLTNLKSLYIDFCQDCEFGPGFSNLTKLKLLHLSSRNEEKRCNKPLIKNTTFIHLSQIKTLILSSCKISIIEPGAFSPLSVIESLDISYNPDLTFSGMNTALHGLRNSTTLNMLNVNAIHSFNGRGTILDTGHVENLKTLKNLKELYMDMNKVEVFNKTIFYPSYMLPEKIRKLTFTGNRLTYDSYIFYIFNAKNITTLDISRQHLNYDPFYNEHFTVSKSNKLGYFEGIDCSHCGKNISKKSPFCFPENVKEIKWRKSFLYFTIPSLHICGAKLLVYLDLSFNLLSIWNGPVYGLENLKWLDLSENYCDYFNSTSFFSSFPSLEFLNLTGNHLGKVFNNGLPNSSQSFQNQTKLKTLDMSANQIEKLPFDIFSAMTSLFHLNISNNKLYDLNVALDKAECLRILDLSSNKFIMFSTELRNQLDTIANSECNKNETLHINLAENPLECTCHTLPFLQWSENSRSAILLLDTDQCRMSNGEVKSLDRDRIAVVEFLKSDCKDYFWLIIGLAVFSSCIICTSLWVIVYRNRWKLRYFYYVKKKRRHVNKGFDRLFENDAFISYPSDAAVFIKNCLVPALESDHALKVWVADRDSAAGVSIAENIAHGVSSSRKTVLLLNRKYMKDHWCDYEMNMAIIESIEAKRNVIIIVQMEDIPCAEIPLGVLKLLKTKTVLEYPIHPQNLGTFWNSLVDEIMS